MKTCHDCGKEIDDPREDVHTNSAGEDVCEDCCDACCPAVLQRYESLQADLETAKRAIEHKTIELENCRKSYAVLEKDRNETLLRSGQFALDNGRLRSENARLKNRINTWIETAGENGGKWAIAMRDNNALRADLDAANKQIADMKSALADQGMIYVPQNKVKP